MKKTIRLEYLPFLIAVITSISDPNIESEIVNLSSAPSDWFDGFSTYGPHGGVSSLSSNKSSTAKKLYPLLFSQKKYPADPPTFSLSESDLEVDVPELVLLF